MRLGTRRSALALAQAKLVAELLGGAEIVPIATRGDRGAGGDAATAAAGDRAPVRDPAHGGGPEDKSRWVAELEEALAAGEIDLAVHSAKDVPGELREGLSLMGAPARAAAEDVLCGAAGLGELAPGARVGTSSVRRIAQLRAAREDLHVVAVRGNVDTRLRKLEDRDQALAAIVLARAGLQRLGRDSEAGAVLDPERFVPAPGQGVLALEGRSDDARARAAVEAVIDPEAFACLLAERALAQALGADCHTPLGAHASPAGGGRLLLRAWVGLPDGSEWARDERLGDLDAPADLGGEVAERLTAAGAAGLLSRAQEMAGVGSS